MAVRIAPEQIENAQRLEAAVAGPDGATRLFILTGALPINLSAFSNGAQTVQQTQTFTVLLGPSLQRRQFIQAVATASLARKTASLQAPPAQMSWQVIGADADWDDESRQVELRVEVNVAVSGANNFAVVNAVSFQVTILAELAE